MYRTEEVRIVSPDDDRRRLRADQYEVYLNGELIRPSRVQIDLDAGRAAPPTVTLDFPYAVVSALEGRVAVVLASGLEDVLISLGWTPPTDGAG